MIKVQILTQGYIQNIEIKHDFNYCRDLVEKCVQKLNKNVKLYQDKECFFEINPDRSLDKTQNNYTFYAKIMEDEPESVSQYGEVVCWFRQDGVELQQGVQLRSDFTFEEVLEDAKSQGIIQDVPKQIKVTNYNENEILATLMEMQMFKLIDSKVQSPQFTIHFNIDGTEPQVGISQSPQFPQNIIQFQGFNNNQSSQMIRNQNVSQFRQFQNPQQSFCTQNKQPQSQQSINNQNFQQQPSFPVQKPFYFNNNNSNDFNISNSNSIQQSQQILQNNIGLSNFQPIIQQNQQSIQANQFKPFQGQQQQQTNQSMVFNSIPPDKNTIKTFPNKTNLTFPSDKNSVLTQPNQNNPFISPPINSEFKQPNQNFQIHQQQQQQQHQQQQQQQQQQQHQQQQQQQQQQINKNLQLLETNAINQLESSAVKCIHSMIIMGKFSFYILHDGKTVLFKSQKPEISGYFLEARGKNTKQDEKNLIWETRNGVQIALKNDFGFVIKWMNETYNSLKVNFF